MSLEQLLFGTTFQNPILLAAGTCGFGEEIEEVVDLEALGGIMTKSVTLSPRAGNPAPRVTELGAGMLNSIGLANPGVERVKSDKLPWLRDHLARARVFVSLAGHSPGEYSALIDALDEEEGFLGYELNLSCPNDSGLGRLPFALDLPALEEVVRGARKRTERPLIVKLAPNTPDIGEAAAIAEGAGADGLTLVNTLPGLALDPVTCRPLIGAGPGGLSGPALRAVGIHAIYQARRRTKLPLIGAGGISNATDAVQYLLAGASLVQIGTASFADPRAAERVIRGLRSYCRRHGVTRVGDLTGAAEMTGKGAGKGAGSGHVAAATADIAPVTGGSTHG